jgi:N-acetylated-alpha-linked acidic dipeptidase
MKSNMSGTEQTPLLTTVRVEPPRRRYTHNVLRRFCTIALSSTLIWFLLAFFVTLLVDPASRKHYPYRGHHRGHHRQGNDVTEARAWLPGHGRKLTNEQLEKILLETPDSKKAEEWSKYYTEGAHLAGQNYSQALWTKEKWEEFGVKSEIVAYEAYLNRPIDNRLALLHKDKDGDGDADGCKVEYEASLKEDVLQDDPTTNSSNSIPVFHGYSASGNVTAPIVWVNYGTYQDFEDLRKANVSLEGKIAIARYGGKSACKGKRE